ncbi:hypothetical protein [Streptomyces sp. NPDC049879]|uniref:hypothetical protein n=1 Tax=Streptomyces sp. NPDC049879 TaxID=3365598 RepID=UPI0037B6BC92
MAQKTPAEMRADAEAALTPLGQERMELLARLDEIDSELRPLVLEALTVEVSERRIAQLTALARGTIRAWRAKGA